MTERCEYCAEEIEARAIRCPHCGERPCGERPRRRQQPSSWSPRSCGSCALTLVACSVLAFVTFDLVVAPYPPADWEEAAFTGTVVGLEGPPGKKAPWAIVQTDDGARLRMPRNVHNGNPWEGCHVRKLYGEVFFHWKEPYDRSGDWRGSRMVRPMANPGDGLFAGIGWWCLWFATCLAARAGWRRRRRRGLRNEEESGPGVAQ